MSAKSQSRFTLEPCEPRLLLTTVTGIVINDTNDNGIANAGEPGAGGFAVFIDLNKNGVRNSNETAVRTASNGSYAFANVSAGNYTIRLLPRTGWRLRTTTHTIAVPSTGSVTVANFTGTQKTRISGAVFTDSNANSSPDSGEGVPNIRLFLDSNNNASLGPGERSALTNSAGVYQFVNLAPGSYNLRQILPAHTSAVTPSNNHSVINLSVGGVVSKSNDFIDTGFTTISGNIFYDSNGDGVKNSDETSAQGLTVYLDLNLNARFDPNSDATAITDSSGNYIFRVAAGADYYVSLNYPNGSFPTAHTPDAYRVRFPIAGSINANKNFSITPNGPGTTGFVTGYIFNDTNSNGSMDRFESPYIGLTAWVDTNRNHIQDNGEPTTTTDSNGMFLMIAPSTVPFNVRINEPINTNFTNATPFEYLNLTVAPGATLSNINFSLIRIF